MGPPGAPSPAHQHTLNHSAEVHRPRETRRDVLVQCDACGSKATARIDRRGFTSRSIRAVDSITLANRRWDADRGEKTGAALREARRAPVSWHHDGCGGVLRSYDIGSTS